MNIYKTYDIYDRNTGEKKGSEKKIEKTLCDFTGKELDGEEITYTADYGCIDPCVGCQNYEYELIEKYPEFEEYLHEILLQPFVVISNSYDENKKEIISEMKKAFIDKLNEFDDFFVVDQAFRKIKANTIKKLLDSGEYTVDQFIPY